MRGNFRVWDSESKRYDYMGDFFITTDGELLKDVGSYSVEIWRCEHNEPGRYIAEFSTGIKGKDGDEIYEGDILLCGAGETYQGRSEYEATVKVELGFTQAMWEMLQYDTLEIIGNIHENPELLENR